MLKISVFNKSVAILLSGTAFSQLLGIAVLPVLTRLYTPEQMGLLAVYTAVVTILLTVVCLRLESAIPIQTSDVDARNVLTFCIQLALATSLLILVFCIFFKLFFKNYIDDFQEVILYVPAGVFVGGVYVALNAYALKCEKFNLVSKSRVIQAASCALIQVLGVLIYQSAIWLIVGFIFNLGAGIGFLKNKLKVNKLFDLSDLKNSRDVLKQNINFPKFSVIESFSNAAGIQLPILLIAYSMSVSEAAFLFLAMKLIQAPMALLGSSISQVFYSQANDKLLNGELTDFTKSVLVTTLKIGVGPIICISILAPIITQQVLGQEWSHVGEYILIMSPWFVIQFLSSPISPIMYVMSKQKKFMYLTLFGLILKLGATIVAVLYGSYVVETLVLSNAIFYLICFSVFLNVAGLSFFSIVKIIMQNFYIIFSWILSSVLILIIFERWVFYV